MQEVKVGVPINNLELELYYPKKGEVKKVKTSDFQGKWLVLVFYPADFTFVCPTELKDLNDHSREIKKLGELIAISTDTVYSHKVFCESEQLLADLEYPLAGDANHKISSIFGVLDETSGLARRGTFIIDPDGVLRAAEINDFSVGRRGKELLRKLKAFDYVRKNPGQVCPADWEVGKPTITPSINIAGRVYEVLK
ncbi:MAG: redoxin domain-containing protein [bacterium]